MIYGYDDTNEDKLGILLEGINITQDVLYIPENNSSQGISYIWKNMDFSDKMDLLNKMNISIIVDGVTYTVNEVKEGRINNSSNKGCYGYISWNFEDGIPEEYTIVYRYLGFNGKWVELVDEVRSNK